MTIKTEPPLRTLIGRLEKASEQVIAAMSTNITAELIEKTPVDTGWARANWIPAIGSPSLSGSGEPGNVGSAKAQQAAGTAALLSFQLPQTVFISNNVPYITRLNEGSSNQAPAGFVQRAIIDGIKSLERRSLG